jgi:preprotein translocase subunit SecY
MNTFFEKIKIVLKDPSMRKRILFALGALVVFRALATIPIPGIDAAQLSKLLNGNQLLGFFDTLSGGGISKLSIVMLGVGPYITASIIIQLLTMMVPSLKAMLQEDGELGRQKLSQYSRLLSIPLAMMQAFGFLTLLVNQNVLAPMSAMAMLVNVIIVTGGSVLLMWIGELISEFGIGNGVSLIIFSGIVAVLPTKAIQFYQTYFQPFDPAQLPNLLILLVVAVVVVVGVVLVTEAERPVPVTYAKQVRGNKVYGGVSTYLPLRLNQAGVIPIIFALSILLLPQIAANLLSHSSNVNIADIATSIDTFLKDGTVHGVLYFLFVFVFTYFYTAITFDPKQISENLQKGGAFIPGVRPGESTMNYLGKVVTRITLVGALFLGLVAVLPNIVQGFTGTTTLAIGGTALLIVVSVVLDLIKKVDAQVTMREY